MAKKKNTRASNGMGSIRQRKDGRWEARYTTPDGRQRSVYAQTEKEVTAKLRGQLHMLDCGAWREPSKMTVGEWLDIWVADYCTHTTASTRVTYERILRVHFKPVIGNVKLPKLSPVHVRRALNDMQRAGKATKTIYTARGVLRAALNAAVQSGLINTNPSNGVPVARVKRPEMHIIDRPMYPAFIEAAHETPYPEALILLLQTGMRSGELRGLEWDDIDEVNRVIHIRRQLHTWSRGEATFDAPKEGKGRDIIVGPEVINTIRAQRKRLAEMQLKAKNWYNGPEVKNLVFRAPTGKQLHDRALLEAVHHVGTVLNIPGLHTHDLRHSYAVAALRSGADVKTVQHNLGHATAAMTLDTYAAYTTDAGQVAAEKLSDYWQNATKKGHN